MRVSRWMIATLFLAASAMIVSVPAGEQYQSAARDEGCRSAPGEQQASPMRQPGMLREGVDVAVEQRTGQLQITQKQFRASQLMGLEVKDRQNETLGEIHDIVIGPAGVVRYVALSSGGLLGIGETLTAVPWTVLHLEAARGEGEKISIVLDINAERFKQAPTFSENDWPNFESPQWVARLESFYGVERTAMRPETQRGFFQQQEQQTQSGLQEGRQGQATQPGQTEPGQTEPGQTEPGQTQPGQTQPGQRDEYQGQQEQQEEDERARASMTPQ